MTARDRLDRALVDMAEKGRRPICGEYRDRGRDWWTSDDYEEREAAAHLCRGCELLALCEAVAAEERAAYHVWAGVDRTKKAKGAGA